MANWKGTAVPNSGTIEKVYLNTNLSVEDVVEIISQLNFDYHSSFEGVVCILSTTDVLNDMLANSLIIAREILEDNSIAYAIVYNDEAIFSTTSLAGFEGWNASVTSPLEINTENTIALFEQAFGFDNQNDKLSTLFSITPFEQEEVTLEGLLTDTCEAIREKEGTTDKIPALDIPSRIRALSSGGSGLIEVDELPTENIDENAIYKIPRKFVDCYLYSPVMSGFLSQKYNLLGAEEVETKPTSNIQESTTSSFYIYYVTSENDMFVYLNAGAGLNWYNASQVLALQGMSGLTFKGELEKSELTLTDGYYAYFKYEKNYKSINNELTEIDNYSRVFSNILNGEFIPKLEINFSAPTVGQRLGYGINTDYFKVVCSGYYNENMFSMGDGVFQYCKAKTIYIKHLKEGMKLFFGDGTAFGSCPNLTKLVLDFDDIDDVYYNSANGYGEFNNSPIAEGNGYVYVPDDKVETVKAMAGWIGTLKDVNTQIKPLSEYVEE